MCAALERLFERQREVEKQIGSLRQANWPNSLRNSTR